MGKMDFCIICEYKGADQLCSNNTAAQRLFFDIGSYSILFRNFKLPAFFCDYRSVHAGPGWKPGIPVFSRRSSYYMMALANMSLLHQKILTRGYLICVSHTHQENMSVKCIPLKPHFYIEKRGKRGYTYFSYFCSKP